MSRKSHRLPLTPAHRRMRLSYVRQRRLLRLERAVLEAFEQDSPIDDWAPQEDERPLQRHLQPQAPVVARHF